MGAHGGMEGRLWVDGVCVTTFVRVLGPGQLSGLGPSSSEPCLSWSPGLHPGHGQLRGVQLPSLQL